MKTKRIVLWAALMCAVALPAPVAAQSGSGQAVLEVLRRIETLEERLQRIENDLSAPTAAAASPVNTAGLENSISQLKADVDGLEGTVGEVLETQTEVTALGERVATLDEQLAGLHQELAAAEPEADEALEGLKAELAELVAELRGIAAEAAEAENVVPEGPQISFAGRVHTQYASTSVDRPIASAFTMRRARLTASVKINDFVSGKVQPDFGSGKISLKDAYFRFAFPSGTRMTVGQFKRPFDLFELTSSTQTLVIERAGKIDGAGDCAGVGDVCSFSRLSEKLGFADRDIGVMFDGKLGAGDWAYSAAITNGTGANKAEENTTKSFGGRLTYSGFSGIKLSANGAWHDYTNGLDSTRTHAPAWGVDAEWGSFSGGWHAQVGAMTGDNWKRLDDAGVPATFRAAQAILSYKHPVEGVAGIEAVEPLGRVSWATGDTSVMNSDEWFYTGGVALHFVGRNKLAVNLESWAPFGGDREWSLKVQSYLHF